jgi:hypothetical protein
LNQRRQTLEILRHLATKPGHDEVKADFRQLLVEEFGAELSALEFERRVPEVKGRLDALIGRTIFEAKSDLVKEWADVERRMPDYLADREREEREKFVGVASDRLRWVVFELDSGRLVKVSERTLDPEKAPEFLAWLDGAVALKSSLPPDPLTIRIELGQDSVAFRRAAAQLTALWSRLKSEPAVLLKRQLWSQLLKLVYGKDVESDTLWIQHTFLVIVAKAIAVAVLGLREDDPRDLLSGRAFEAAGISGAVESDFFNWVVVDAEGQDVVRRIATHVRRFRLGEVESDVLKILYESLIDRDERHGLGEYYTPDWLAAKVVRNAVDRPLEQRVLDPACGSGTFLFHAVRRFLAEAEDAGVPIADRSRVATDHVAGMDIHPVAVIIARVTFLLALAPVLSARSGGLSIPVFLGDAMQLFGRRDGHQGAYGPGAARRAGRGCDKARLSRNFLSRSGLVRQGRRGDARRLRSGPPTVSSRSASHARGRDALQARRDQGREVCSFGPRRDLSRIRRLAARRTRFRVGLRGSQSLASPRLLGWGRLGACSRRKPALGRLSAHEPGSAKAVQGVGEGRAGLCGREARDAERFVGAFHGSCDLPLSATRRTNCVRAALGCPHPWAVRTIPLRLVSLCPPRL